MSSRSIFWGRYNCSAKKNEAVPPRGARCAPRRERRRSAPALPPARCSATTALRCEGEQGRLTSTSTAGSRQRATLRPAAARRPGRGGAGRQLAEGGEEPRGGAAPFRPRRRRGKRRAVAAAVLRVEPPERSV